EDGPTRPARGGPAEDVAGPLQPEARRLVAGEGAAEEDGAAARELDAQVALLQPGLQGRPAGDLDETLERVELHRRLDRLPRRPAARPAVAGEDSRQCQQ